MLAPYPGATQAYRIEHFTGLFVIISFIDESL